MVKNALADYLAEQFEIAPYTSLLATAQMIGDQQTVAVCQQIPAITQEYLGMRSREHGAA